MRNLCIATKSRVNTNSLTKIFLFGWILCLFQIGLVTQLVAQNNYVPASTGTVNFTLGATTLPTTHAQTVSLYGCNTRITINGRNWNASDSLGWGKANQLLDSVPFGLQIDTITGDSFYISKYYIAAPPVIDAPLFNIGKVIPDHFTFDAENQMQSVYFDYTRVKLMYVKFIKVIFDTSFINTGITILPINIECNNFPWIDSNKASEIGASGIGDLQVSKSANFSGLFLPYYFNNEAHTDSTFLNCEVTILDDIIPHHKIEFEVNGKTTSRMTSINLSALKNDTITVVRSGPKLEMPCGCSKPDTVTPCE